MWRQPEHAADVLDIDRVTLYHKLKKYGWSRSSMDRDKKPDEVAMKAVMSHDLLRSECG